MVPGTFLDILHKKGTWYLLFFALLFSLSGCATLFGWTIHAPGILSGNYFEKVRPVPNRVGLYLEPSVWNYISKNKGGWTADPQTYYVGEAYVPMVIEGFQNAFDEFILFEVPPTEAIVKQYGIQYLAVVKVTNFGNDVTMKGQAVQLRTETAVFDQQFHPLAHFETSGVSDAKKVFSKKGGLEVNFNAAIENNVISLVQYIQDSIQTGNWQR